MTKIKISIRNFVNAPKILIGQDLFSNTWRVIVDNKGNNEI